MAPCTITDSDPMEKEGCIATSVEEINACLQSGQNAVLNQDIAVDSSDCNGNGVINVTGLNNVGIYGCGHRIYRTSGQAQCSLLYGNGTKGFFSDGVTWEEVPGPEVPELGTYDHMLHFINACDVCFVNSEVAHSWGYALYTNGVDGFKFKNSIMRDAGLLGLYIGHSQNATTDFLVCNSTFTCNTTNALAILGGDGGCVENNFFDDNHKLGVFPVAPQFGNGFTGGGQVYLAQVNDLKFENNCIQNGFCSNCVTAGIFQNPVTGLELGIPNQGVTVTNTTIDNNKIINNTAYGTHLNSNSSLDATTQFCGNTITGNGVDIAVPAANYKP